ncbi:hypothetical protein [Actinomadura rayongensis]|uniref:TPM domain-containing protein n=1 Tax=Actinomadura rayongensis TaxID=1429076 RepID=A0A6I4WIQ9_9ACTN|nr:hypothetical protein [Actinomadura rayongensis]MXQ67606.1 hypothetical protein [Actinomadura rayongensis]
MRRGLLVLILGLTIPTAATPARADGTDDRRIAAARADRLAALWRRDPVQVTDHAPRALPADAATRIRAAVARLREPVYVAVEPPLPGRVDAADLLPLVHDRLGRDGVYLIVSVDGPLGAARQYGTGPVTVPEHTLTAAAVELPSDAGAVAVVERFVDVALAGDVSERLRAGNRPVPKTRLRRALERRDAAERHTARVEGWTFAAGTALGGGIVAAVLVRHRRGRRRARR